METDAKTIDNCLTVLGINGRGEWVGWSFPWVALLGAYGGRPAMARNTLLDGIPTDYHYYGVKRISRF